MLIAEDDALEPSISDELTAVELPSLIALAAVVDAAGAGPAGAVDDNPLVALSWLRDDFIVRGRRTGSDPDGEEQAEEYGWKEGAIRTTRL
jgi:hypothetical protein